MAVPVRVNLIENSDIAAAGRLFEASFDEPYGAAAISDLLRPQSAFGLVATTMEPAGFVIASTAADEAEILSIGVAPAFRRCGIASQLIRHAAWNAERRGAQKLFLEVASDNTGASSLYQTMGFEQVGLRKRYYRRANGVMVDARILLLSSLKFESHAG